MLRKGMAVMMVRWLVLIGLIFMPWQPALAAGDDDKPCTLDQAVTRLMTMSPDSFKDDVRAGSIKDLLHDHEDLTGWVRTIWIKYGCLAPSFNAMGIEQVDDMATLVMEDFWHRVRAIPYPLAERIDYLRKTTAARMIPTAKSPVDGAKIAWVLIIGDGPQSAHLGISLSDETYWHYTQETGPRPANADDKKALDALQVRWRDFGLKLDDLKNKERE